MIKKKLIDLYAHLEEHDVQKYLPSFPSPPPASVLCRKDKAIDFISLAKETGEAALSLHEIRYCLFLPPGPP